MILEVVGTAFGHFLLGSHNAIVTALGSCVCEAALRNRACNVSLQSSYKYNHDGIRDAF